MSLKPNFVDCGLSFTSLTSRDFTDLIVIHHTGNPKDDDLSAKEIHAGHLAQGWAGIGYHFVIRKNGRIELGRPMGCVGAHAYGYNSHSVGIHFCGNFEVAKPTKEQIESAAILMGWLAEKYGIKINGHTVLGHRDLMATACPGQNLYDRLPDIRGKAVWYQAHYKGGQYHE